MNIKKIITKIKFKFPYLIGKIIFKLNFRLNCSTDIVGFDSYGYGKLDSNGFFQFPVKGSDFYKKFIKK